jgi:glycosyl transferase family 25
MMDLSFPPIFVINLKQSADRRVAMTARLEPLHVNYSFFEAVDGRLLDIGNLPSYAKTRRRIFYGRDLTPGEIGCLLSHKAIYQHMVDNDIERAIILEDDVFIDPAFAQVIRSILKAPLAWDIIRFLAQDKVQNIGRIVYSLSCKPYTLARIPATPGGAYGYMLTRKAAARLLQHMQKNILPVDILHGYVWKTGLETFLLRPSPVSADMVIESTIGYGQRFDKTLQLSDWQKAVYPFTRAWLKLSELVCKRAAYWLAWSRDQRFT